jgi:hypothetical protein
VIFCKILFFDDHNKSKSFFSGYFPYKHDDMAIQQLPCFRFACSIVFPVVLFLGARAGFALQVPREEQRGSFPLQSLAQDIRCFMNHVRYAG